MRFSTRASRKWSGRVTVYPELSFWVCSQSCVWSVDGLFSARVECNFSFLVFFCFVFKAADLNKMAVLWMWIYWVKPLLWIGHCLLMWNSSDEVRMTNSSNSSNHESPRSRCDTRLFGQTFLSSALSHTSVNFLPYTSLIKTKTNLAHCQLRRTCLEFFSAHRNWLNTGRVVRIYLSEEIKEPRVFKNYLVSVRLSHAGRKKDHEPKDHSWCRLHLIIPQKTECRSQGRYDAVLSILQDIQNGEFLWNFAALFQILNETIHLFTNGSSYSFEFNSFQGTRTLLESSDV